MSKINPSLVALPERISTQFWSPNPLKIYQKWAQNLLAKMKVHHGGRKCCQNVSRRLAEAQKISPDATNYFQEPLNLGPRAFPSVFLLCKNAKLQFIIRSLQVASSITGYFHSYVKNYSHNSQLAVDSTAFHPSFAS